MNNKYFRTIIRIILYAISIFLIFKLLMSFITWYKTGENISFFFFAILIIILIALEFVIPKEHTDNKIFNIKLKNATLKELFNKNKSLKVKKIDKNIIYEYKKENRKFIFIESNRLNNSLEKIIKKEILIQTLYSFTKMLSFQSYPLYIILILKTTPNTRILKRLNSKVLIYRRGRSPVTWSIPAIISPEEGKLTINGLDYTSFNVLPLYDVQINNLLNELEKIGMLNINDEL